MRFDRREFRTNVDMGPIFVPYRLLDFIRDIHQRLENVFGNKLIPFTLQKDRRPTLYAGFAVFDCSASRDAEAVYIPA